MSNAYKEVRSGDYKRFRVWIHDTSVPWPMAFGSCGTRLVCLPFGTVTLSSSSFEDASSYLADPSIALSLYVVHLSIVSALGSHFIMEIKI
jgi:hypothetical protein